MARLSVLFLGLIAFSCNVCCNGDSKYDNYALVQLIPKHEKHLDAIQIFQDPDEQAEVLKRSRGLNDTFDVLIPTNRTSFLEDFADIYGLDFKVKHDNYGRSFDSVARQSRRRLMGGFNVYAYNQYSAIQEAIEAAAQRHPELVKLQSLGTSFQGREMKLVKISRDPYANNPIIFVDAGIHAREWVAPAMALYLIHRLTNDPHNKETVGVDWHILPVVNPDGYEFTRSSRSNRLWRKTRSRTSQFNCFGVDGNRNYGYRWGIVGVSKNPCDKETYAGPQPFSEPETKMVRDALMQHADRIKLYVSLHSYGQYLVYPWGYTGDFLPKEWKRLDNLARKVSDGVQRAGGKPFKVMSAGKWYPAAGGSDDFAFGAVGVPYSYTMELTDGYEFQFPESLLRTALPQFYEGFKVFANHIRSEFGTTRTKREILLNVLKMSTRS